jgi:hypothetical protein
MKGLIELNLLSNMAFRESYTREPAPLYSNVRSNTHDEFSGAMGSPHASVSVTKISQGVEDYDVKALGLSFYGKTFTTIMLHPLSLSCETLPMLILTPDLHLPFNVPNLDYSQLNLPTDSGLPICKVGFSNAESNVGSARCSEPPETMASSQTSSPYAFEFSDITTLEMETRLAVEEDKRRRNQVASARFREKKKRRDKLLEEENKRLVNQVAAQREQITRLESENQWLKELIRGRAARNAEKVR